MIQLPHCGVTDGTQQPLCRKTHLIWGKKVPEAKWRAEKPDGSQGQSPLSLCLSFPLREQISEGTGSDFSFYFLRSCSGLSRHPHSEKRKYLLNSTRFYCLDKRILARLAYY